MKLSKKLNEILSRMLSFTIILIFVSVFIELNASGNLKAFKESFVNGNWIKYVLYRVCFVTIYGIVGCFFFKTQKA